MDVILSDDQSSGNPRAASVRISAHDAKGHSGQRRHDLRIGSQPGYVDPERTDQNRVLIKPPTPAIMRRIAENRRVRQGAQRAMKSNAAISTAGIITFGSEAARMFEALTPDQQDQAFRLLSRAVANLTSDEDVGPHIQCRIKPGVAPAERTSRAIKGLSF